MVERAGDRTGWRGKKGLIEGGGSFTHAAFLVGDGDDFHAVGNKTGKHSRLTGRLAIKTAGRLEINGGGGKRAGLRS